MRPVSVIEADLDKYRARLDRALDPDRAERLKHGEREFSRASGAGLISQLRREISRLEAELARAKGSGSPRRPLGV